jgi:hypothetical protein
MHFPHPQPTFNPNKLNSHLAFPIPKNHNFFKDDALNHKHSVAPSPHSDFTSTVYDNLLPLTAMAISVPSSFIVNRWAAPVAYILVHPNPAVGLSALPSELLAGTGFGTGMLDVAGLFGMSTFFPVLGVFAI